MKNPRKPYKADTQQWYEQLGRRPFGRTTRSGVDLLTAVFARNDESPAVAEVRGAGWLHAKLINPRIRDWFNVEVLSRLNEEAIRWVQHSEDGSQMHCRPLDVPGTRKINDHVAETNFKARFDVRKDTLETISSRIKLADEWSRDGFSEIHVNVQQSPPGPVKSSPARVVILYARADRHWLDRFTNVLRPAVMNKVIDLWSDLQIPAGSDWPQEISRALEECDAALLLGTKDSFATDFLVKRELPFLRSKSKRVCWVAVDSALHTYTEFADVQCLNDPKAPIATFPEHSWDTHVSRACSKFLRELSPDAATLPELGTMPRP